MELLSHPHVHRVQVGEVMQVTLNRADQDNRMSNSMLEALTESVLVASRTSRLLVLSAQGPDFCLGRDMPPPPVGSNTTAEQVLRDDAAPVLALIDAILACPVPLLCAVQGRTWGIGLVLAAVADVTVAAEDSRFRLRELERGIPPCLAMAHDTFITCIPKLNCRTPLRLGSIEVYRTINMAIRNFKSFSSRN